ncbi:alpha/beta fold hydrolase [Acidovorax sp. NCPPB 2350]|nr:alpha/beta fold hydrolase [Acidovorax sp. NCPPB 2350]
MGADAVLALLCLPCAGSSATMYLRWRRALASADIDVVPVELPGRGARMHEPFASDYATLVRQLTETCLHAAGGRPFVLLGHSMGSLLAYGVARRLQEMGDVSPAALVVSACAAPTRRDATRYAAPLSDERLVADLREQNGTPSGVFSEPELLRLTLDVLRADYRICHGFERPTGGDLLSCPIHAIAGRADRIRAPDVDAWGQETRNAFSTDWLDGGHFFIREHEAAFLDTLVRRLSPRRKVSDAALLASPA